MNIQTESLAKKCYKLNKNIYTHIFLCIYGSMNLVLYFNNNTKVQNNTRVTAPNTPIDLLLSS